MEIFISLLCWFLEAGFHEMGELRVDISSLRTGKEPFLPGEPNIIPSSAPPLVIKKNSLGSKISLKYNFFLNFK